MPDNKENPNQNTPSSPSGQPHSPPKPAGSTKTPDAKAAPPTDTKKPVEPSKAPDTKAAPVNDAKKPAEPPKGPDAKATPATDAPHRHQLADLHSGLDIQLVGGIFENIQDVLIVGPLRRGGQAQSKIRREVGQNFLICIRRSVVGLVYDDVAEIIRFEPLQVQSHALNTAANHKSAALLHALHIAAHRSPGPQLPEGLGGLIHQFHRVGQEQRAFAEALGIHDGGHRLASAGCVIKQGDGLKVAAHLLQRHKSLFLMLLQIQLRAVQRLAPLSGEVILDLPETGMLAQEYPQLILDGFRLLLHLPHRPAVYIPPR